MYLQNIYISIKVILTIHRVIRVVNQEIDCKIIRILPYRSSRFSKVFDRRRVRVEAGNPWRHQGGR